MLLSNIPQIRFPGFNQPWKKTKLIDNCERISVGLATSVTEHYRDTGVPIVRNQNIKGGYFDGTKMLYLCEDFAEANESKAAKGLDVVTVRTGSNLGQTCVLPKEFDNCQTFTTLITTPTQSALNSYFLSIHMNSVFGKKEFARLQVGGGKDNMNTSHLKSYKIYAPELEEQQKIADFLSSVDKKISLLKEKHTLLTQYKKGAMQKLFKQELRFKDEHGNDFPDWELKKGNKIFDAISNKNHDSDLPILAITQEHGAIPRELINYQVQVTEGSVAGYKVVDKGDFIISLRSFQGGIEYSNYKGICSPAYIILRPSIKVNDDFYRYYLKTGNFIQEMKKRLEGIRDGKILSYKYFSEIKLPNPCVEEQQKIAEFLGALDVKINAVHEQVELTQTFKKGLLQQMFV